MLSSRQLSGLQEQGDIIEGLRRALAMAVKHEEQRSGCALHFPVNGDELTLDGAVRLYELFRVGAARREGRLEAARSASSARLDSSMTVLPACTQRAAARCKRDSGAAAAVRDESVRSRAQAADLAKPDSTALRAPSLGLWGGSMSVGYAGRHKQRAGQL